MTVREFKEWMSANGITDEDEFMIDGCKCKLHNTGNGRFLGPIQEYLKVEPHPLDSKRKMITIFTVDGYKSQKCI